MLTWGGMFTVADAAKPKKEKKEITWDWDGKLSGNKVIDDYLVCIDTTYRNVQQYKETMDNFRMYNDTITIGDKYYAVAYMLNGKGELVSRGQVNWQCANAIADGLLIVLDITNAQLATATAVLELPNLGLDAFTYGKYVKGGAAVFTKGLSEVKTMRSIWIGNSKKWKSVKTGAIEDPSVLNLFDEESLAKINKCCFIKEISPEDAAYTAVVEQKKAKSEEELNAEAEKFAKEFAQRNVAPEDASKTLDDISDEELEKSL